MGRCGWSVWAAGGVVGLSGRRGGGAVGSGCRGGGAAGRRGRAGGAAGRRGRCRVSVGGGGEGRGSGARGWAARPSLRAVAVEGRGLHWLEGGGWRFRCGYGTGSQFAV